MNLYRLVMAIALTASLVACPEKQTKDASAQSADPAKEAPSEADKPQEPAVTDAPGVPAGVEHLQNAKWEDKQTPTDKPEWSRDAGDGAWTAAKKAYDERLAGACKAGGDKVYRLEPASRVGYVSFKNEILLVAGKFDEVVGFGTLGEDAQIHFRASALSINSGDEVRDARLAKLFFELEDAAHAVITFDSTEVTGLDKGLPPVDGERIGIEAKGKLSLHGKSVDAAFPLEISREDGKYTVKLRSPMLLSFSDYGLLEPLGALLAACNHKAMGTSVSLELDLTLRPGCS